MAKSLEDRIVKVEKEIELLKSQLNSLDGSKDKSNWISDITGSFKGDEDFDEILRLGREERESDRNSNEF